MASNPNSQALAQKSRKGYVNGVPMQWMLDWPMPFPLFIDRGEGATLFDVDQHSYADFCLGDTGAMFGHSPPAVVEALREQARHGFTHMLPTKDAMEVGALLADLFGLPSWQIALTATDANRFALRLARAVTGRSKILVFNGCYHGTVDETFVRLEHGKPIHRPGLMGQFVDLTERTRVVEFNDIVALRSALAGGDIACVITEPVLTNASMVLPEAGFLHELRRLTRQHGTLLLIDETHTISSGKGGYSRVHNLDPDLWVCGKAIAGGVPTAVWGMSAELSQKYEAILREKEPGHSGMGTTLSANALSLAALRATLQEVMTRANYDHMEALAGLLDAELSQAIQDLHLPWHISRVGARVEFIFSSRPLKNATEAAATHYTSLEQAVHLGLLNQGVIIAPFHNMMLLSPVTTREQVGQLVAAFRVVAGELRS